MSVVSGGSEETTIWTKFQHAAVVAAFTALGIPFDDFFLIDESFLFDCETADSLSDEICW